MRFTKPVWTVGIKRMVQNFEAYLHQVELGRRIVIQGRDGYRVALDPIPENMRHRLTKRRRGGLLSRKLSKLWD